MLGNKQLTNKVVSKEYKKSVIEFEKSQDNTVRSIATYYASGVMGKQKYKSVRLVLSMKSNESKTGKKKQTFQLLKAVRFQSCSLIDNGPVNEIDPDYLEGEGLETENPVNGMVHTET